jgi:enoyl-CoA hydratase
MEFKSITYEVRGRRACITLNRPERMNAIDRYMPREIAEAVSAANEDNGVHVIVVTGAGKGFCGGYDLVEFAEREMPNHDPTQPWDPVLDWQMMSRNLRGFMSLFHSDKPVLCKVHGFCVAGGTDMALCSDLLVIADDAKIGYPPARVWGSPTTAMWMYRLGLERCKRLLLTGDPVDGRRAVEWGLASEAVPADELEAAGRALAERVALLPGNQLHMMKVLVNQAFEQMGLATSQLVGLLLDGAARHTPEGVAFTERAIADVRAAVAERDRPFGDYGQGPRTA